MRTLLILLALMLVTVNAEYDQEENAVIIKSDSGDVTFYAYGKKSTVGISVPMELKSYNDDGSLYMKVTDDDSLVYLFELTKVDTDWILYDINFDDNIVNLFRSNNELIVTFLIGYDEEISWRFESLGFNNSYNRLK